MPGNNGGGGRRQPLRPAASAPPLLGSWPRKAAGLEGTRGCDGASAPGTLTQGPALHAPAAAPAGRPRSPRAAPSRSSSAGHPPGHCSEHPPRSLPPSLFMAVSKLQPPLEQLRPLMGTRQGRRPGRPLPALPWPCPALPAPARPPGASGRAARRSGAPSGHASRTRANFHDRRESTAPARYLCSSILAGTCPRPSDRPAGRKATPKPQAEAGEERGGKKEKEEEKGGSFSSFSLLAAPPAQAGK